MRDDPHDPPGQRVDEMRRLFGTIEDYFNGGLGIDGEARRGLHAAFIEGD